MGQTVRFVIFPNIAVGLFSGALFAFAHSFDELIVVLFLTSREIATLPKRIWDGMQDDIDPTIAAAAVLLVVLTLGAMAISQLLKARGGRKTSTNDETDVVLGGTAEATPSLTHSKKGASA